MKITETGSGNQTPTETYAKVYDLTKRLPKEKTKELPTYAVVYSLDSRRNRKAVSKR
jgi:hypothetical protein